VVISLHWWVGSTGCGVLSTEGLEFSDKSI
jgi:hypothetical protein